MQLLSGIQNRNSIIQDRVSTDKAKHPKTSTAYVSAASVLHRTHTYKTDRRFNSAAPQIKISNVFYPSSASATWYTWPGEVTHYEHPTLHPTPGVTAGALLAIYHQLSPENNVSTSTKRVSWRFTITRKLTCVRNMPRKLPSVSGPGDASLTSRATT